MQADQPPIQQENNNPQYQPQMGMGTPPYQQQPPQQFSPQQQGYPPQQAMQQPYPAQGYPVQGQPPQGYQQYPPQQQQGYYQGQQIQGQPMMYMDQPPQQQMVVNTTGIILAPRQVPYCANGYAYPTEIICFKCKKRCITTIQTEFGAGTFTMSYILFLLTGFCCCWIPYCMPDCQDKVHKCSNCHEEVGIKPYNIC